jgi:tRNA A-37 threonylcarbamoyl transferase component Bud32
MPPPTGDARRAHPPDDATLPPSAAGNAPDGATVPLTPDVPPELVNHPRYRVLRLLGQGGMGAVYLAEHLVMGRRVALKTISAQLLSNRDAVARFHREVRAAARLVHPNIVTAFDAEQAGGLHFLVMEYVDGASVADFAKRKGALAVDQACAIVSQAAVGLQHAHEQGLIHRDVKPANLMLTRKGQVKVLDFGLAQFTRHDDPAADAAHTTTGAVMGTADYIAPEQTSSSRKVDIRADIYSLGCTLYTLLAGRVPFPDGTVIDKCIHHATDEPTPLASLRPGMPAGLAEVVGKMMAKKPEDRYQVPADVVRALRPFTARGAAPAPPAEDKTEPFAEVVAAARTAKPPRGGKRRTNMANVAGIAMLAVVGLVALLIGGKVIATFLVGGNDAGPVTAKTAPAPTVKQKEPEKPPEYSVAWSGKGPTHALVAPEHTIPGAVLDFKEIEAASLKEFRDWQAALAPDYRLSFLGNRAGVGPPLFNGVAVHERVPLPVRVFVGLTDKESEVNHESFKKEKTPPHLMMHSSYAEAGKFRHSQLWADGGGYVWYGSLENIKQIVKDNTGAQRPYAMDWAAAGNDQLFAVFGTHEKGEWKMYYSLTRDEALATAADYRDRGWRPDAIAPYFDGERYRFMMVVRDNPGPVDWHLQMDMTLPDYKKASAEEKSRGRFPLQVVSYGDEAAVKYAALWVRYKIVD